MNVKAISLIALLSAGAAHAAGDALVIGNSRYDRLQTLFGAARVVAAAEALRDRGFDVAEERDADAAAMQRAFEAFVADIDDGDAGPIVIILAGAFVHSAAGSYLLPVDDRENIEAGRVLLRAFPLDAAMAVLARFPGRAFLVLGEGVPEDSVGPYLETGLGTLTIPQGVTVLRGPGPDVARFAARELPRPGRDLAAAAEAFELELSGFAPAGHVAVYPEDVAPRKDASEGTTEGTGDDGDGTVDLSSGADGLRADDRAWDVAVAGDSAESYQAYVDVYPEGRHAAQARQRLAAIAAEPFYEQRKREEELGLTRDQRRKIQRDLSILGYDTRGIDGIFGRGSRAAIAKWQEAIGREATGYLTAGQIKRLDTQAQRRAQELEEQDAREAEERDRKDRAMWAEVENRADEDGLRGYLEAYPDGVFAARAKELLAEIEARRAERAAVQDRRAWQAARDADSIDAYRAYLSDRPGGAFAREARARITELERASDEARTAARARAEEEALNLNPLARRLAETRLAQLGLFAGPPDGSFDAQTREAIRRFQQARGLRVSGYIDQQTVVRLLADGLRRN